MLRSRRTQPFLCSPLPSRMLSPSCSPCLFAASLLFLAASPSHMVQRPLQSWQGTHAPKDGPHISSTFCIQGLERDLTCSSGNMPGLLRAPPGADPCSDGLPEIRGCTAPGCTGSTLLGWVHVHSAHAFLLQALLPGQVPSLASACSGALAGFSPLRNLKRAHPIPRDQQAKQGTREHTRSKALPA